MSPLSAKMSIRVEVPSLLFVLYTCVVVVVCFHGVAQMQGGIDCSPQVLHITLNASFVALDVCIHLWPGRRHEGCVTYGRSSLRLPCHMAALFQSPVGALNSCAHIHCVVREHSSVPDLCLSLHGPCLPPVKHCACAPQHRPLLLLTTTHITTDISQLTSHPIRKLVHSAFQNAAGRCPCLVCHYTTYSLQRVSGQACRLWSLLTAWMDRWA